MCVLVIASLNPSEHEQPYGATGDRDPPAESRPCPTPLSVLKSNFLISSLLYHTRFSLSFLRYYFSSPCLLLLSNYKLLRQATAFNYKCDLAYSHLTLLNKFVPFSSSSPTVIVVCRNEEHFIGPLLDHYQRIGAQSIHVIDNSSSDATVSIARKFRNVCLWQTSESFSDSAQGYLWRGALARRYGIGKWILNIDSDEFLVFDSREGMNLTMLQNILDSKHLSQLSAPVLDMYPGVVSISHSTNPANIPNKLSHLLNYSQFFDNPLKHMSASCKQVMTSTGPQLVGGVRSRMMTSIGINETPCLHTIPLVKWTEQTAYLNSSRHSIYPAVFTGSAYKLAFLHFKFPRHFSSRVKRIIEEGQYWQDSVEYKRYAAWLGANPNGLLYNKLYSIRYTGPKQLAELGIIQSL